MADEQSELNGQIIKGLAGTYEVFTQAKGIILAKPRGIFRKDETKIYVGDYVGLKLSGDPDIPYQIVAIQPRKNELLRPPVANLDVLVIAVSPAQPKPDLLLLDKLLTICFYKSIEPIIWITKRDLALKRAKAIQAVYETIGYTVFCTTKQDIDTINALDLFDEKTVGFAGLSGVGKSTICNALLGQDKMATAGISQKLKRGRHTTRHVELIAFKGGFLVDTPGFSSLELRDVNIKPADIMASFPELEALIGVCRFDNCRHLGDAGCGIDTLQMDQGRKMRFEQLMKSVLEEKAYGR